MKENNAPFAAERTSMRFVPTVQQKVILQVRLLGEASVTDIALEWPRPIVHVHV